MNVFATYFDKNYLPHGLALIESLISSSELCEMYILCLDDETLGYFQQHKYELKITTISLADLEAADAELLEVRSSRTRIEYYFTITSCWCNYIMSRLDDLKVLVYVDADLYFYEKVSVVIDELHEKSVMIIPHRFSDRNKHLEKYGKYNVGLVAWRKDEWGARCLSDWRKDCLNWCYDRFEDNRFADQKYLDYWPEKDYRVLICNHPGFNVAYYNVGRHNFVKIGDKLTVDGKPLVFYHFHKVERLRRNIFRILLLDEKGYDEQLIFKYIYLPYFKYLFKVERQIDAQVHSLRYKKFDNKIGWLNLYGDCYLVTTRFFSCKLHIRKAMEPFIKWVKGKN